MILGLHGLHCNYVIIDLTLTCSCVCMYVRTYVCMSSSVSYIVLGLSMNEAFLQKSCSGVMYPIAASMAMRPCLISV